MSHEIKTPLWTATAPQSEHHAQWWKNPHYQLGYRRGLVAGAVMTWAGIVAVAAGLGLVWWGMR